MNSLSIIFPEARKIGCFFHYTRALRDKMKKFGLLVKEKYENSIKILKELFDLPYKVKKDLTTIDSLCYKYSEFNSDFINYFRKQCFRYFNNGTLI